MTNSDLISPPRLIEHGAMTLPSVVVDSYNLEIKDELGFIGDRASKKAFRGKLDDLRKNLKKIGADPFGKVRSKDLKKKDIDAVLNGDDPDAAAVVLVAIDDYAKEFAGVLERFLKDSAWKDTARIAVGGGLKESALGELAISRTKLRLQGAGLKVDLVPIRHHPDEAGLIGAAHLMPAWMLDGYDAILAVDIGGTNIRAGVVKTRLDKKKDLSKAKVWKSDLWRHADDSPKRSATIERLSDMLSHLISKAEKEGISLAPVIGVACPGIIEKTGAINRGGQNLPGGNWESKHFNLAAALKLAIPKIGKHETFVIMHNDGVAQGLSQIPFMQDVERWAVVTIGTGLGNARFSNRSSEKTQTQDRR